jgi:hypothetical protein
MVAAVHLSDVGRFQRFFRQLLSAVGATPRLFACWIACSVLLIACRAPSSFISATEGGESGTVLQSERESTDVAEDGGQDPPGSARLQKSTDRERRNRVLAADLLGATKVTISDTEDDSLFDTESFVRAEGPEGASVRSHGSASAGTSSSSFAEEEAAAPSEEERWASLRERVRKRSASLYEEYKKTKIPEYTPAKKRWQSVWHDPYVFHNPLPGPNWVETLAIHRNEGIRCTTRVPTTTNPSCRSPDRGESQKIAGRSMKRSPPCSMSADSRGCIHGQKPQQCLWRLQRHAWLR